VRHRTVVNRFDLIDFEYAQVGEPTVKPKQGIVVGAEVFRSRLASRGVIEHPADAHAINRRVSAAEADEPAGKHVRVRKQTGCRCSPFLAPERASSPAIYSIGKLGNALVCSIRTDFNSAGSIASARRIVGATCELATGVLTTCAAKCGLETIRATFVSAKLMPPCSAFFLPEPV